MIKLEPFTLEGWASAREWLYNQVGEDAFELAARMPGSAYIELVNFFRERGRVFSLTAEDYPWEK